VGGGANPRPSYPLTARRLGLEGRVVLEVTVATDGSPLNVQVADSSGHGVLDRAARRTVRRWQFQPARVGGNTVQSTITVPVRFRLR
jgi:protein TonB